MATSPSHDPGRNDPVAGHVYHRMDGWRLGRNALGRDGG